MPLKHTGKRLLHAFTPAKVVQSRLHKKVIMHFAEKVGLVYFGYVDQRDDEHRLVRGLTVSANHRDNHYCIGTYHGYDVTFVERTDTISFPGKSSKAHDWLIMAFDLRTTVDLPHVFIGLNSHSDTFYAHLFTKFSNLSKAHLGTFGIYPQNFTQRYTVYTPPSDAVSAEMIIDSVVAKNIGDHFGTMTVEIANGCVYLYTDGQRPTAPLLEKMLQYGIWMATTIDRQAVKLQIES